MYQQHPIIKQLLQTHKTQAERIVSSTSSNLVKEAFTSSWDYLDSGNFNASTSSRVIMFNPIEIARLIDQWINECKACKDEEEAKFKQIQDPSSIDTQNFLNLQNDIDEHILFEYNLLKQKVETIETIFANAVRAYRSPLRQALNDITILYNDINHIEGNFTGYENVSVYVHGIEDTGKKFLSSAKKASEIGDVIVYEDRNGNKQYFLVIDNEGEKEIIGQKEFKSLDDLKNHKSYVHGQGRLHLVYETEYKNEHRQKTSDDIADKLIDMGLINDDTNLDMFAHSYGGRRALQFAMDYPDSVRSITTIGTPYDKNWLGKTANVFPGIAEDLANKYPKEYSNYLDFNEKNQRTDDGVLHSNVYTDMKSEAMIEDMDHLKAANPETYQKLDDMFITAAAGRDYTEQFAGRLGIGKVKRYDTHDGAVSVKSQHGESLGALIDDRPSYDVKGDGMTNPAHSNEITHDDFIEKIRQINTTQKE